MEKARLNCDSLNMMTMPSEKSYRLLEQFLMTDYELIRDFVLINERFKEEIAQRFPHRKHLSHYPVMTLETYLQTEPRYLPS